MKCLGRKRRPCLFGQGILECLFTWIRLVQLHGIGFLWRETLATFFTKKTAGILGLQDRHWQSEEVIEQMRALYPMIKCSSWPQHCQPRH